MPELDFSYAEVVKHYEKSRVIYPDCPRCGHRMGSRGTEWVCPRCSKHVMKVYNPLKDVSIDRPPCKYCGKLGLVRNGGIRALCKYCGRQQYDPSRSKPHSA